jgi:hypothetical protein
MYAADRSYYTDIKTLLKIIDFSMLIGADGPDSCGRCGIREILQAEGTDEAFEPSAKSKLCKLEINRQV